jgi:flagellar hook-associated protein 1 FlgK
VSLSVAFNTARSSLKATTTQIAVSGKNVAGASDPSYSRKIVSTTTTADGAARLTATSRATNVPVFLRMLEATSASAGMDVLLSGIERLQETIGDSEDEGSPAALIGKLDSALRLYANTPDDENLGEAVVAAAGNLATKLNEATDAVQTLRADADADIATSVKRVNDLLAQFEDLNKTIVAGTALGEEMTDELDARDAILAQLSEEMGISVVSRENNDLVLYTDGGVTLFETTARSVTFAATPVYGAATVGNAVYVDGVPVTGSGATMPLQAGSLVGLTTLRDETAVTYQNQLDEIARGLVAAFAESDQSGGGGPDLAGLFTYAGGPAIPAAGTVMTGLAGLISVNAAIDPAQGGDVTLLRDGGVNGAAYDYNAENGASFSGRLQGLVSALGAPQSFASAAGITTSTSLAGFGSASVSWLEGRRQNAASDVEYQSTLLAKASETLSNATGVNVDDEYANQLQLEQAYQASAKLMSIIDELYDTLFGAVG